MELGPIFKLFILSIWFGFVLFSIKKYIFGRASSKWPTVSAIVISSRVESKYAGNGLTFHSPEIEYRYTVNNHVYTNNKFTYMGTFGLTNKYASAYAKKHYEGSQLNIYYNPKSPNEAVIIPGVHWVQYASMAFLTIMFFSIAFIIEILNFIWPGCQPNCT